MNRLYFLSWLQCLQQDDPHVLLCHVCVFLFFFFLLWFAGELTLKHRMPTDWKKRWNLGEVVRDRKLMETGSGPNFSLVSEHHVLTAPLWKEQHMNYYYIILNTDVMCSFVALKISLFGNNHALFMIGTLQERHKLSLGSWLRQPGWRSMCGLFAAADSCSFLTGWKTSAEMTTANDLSHRGTEQRWNCDLFLSLCLFSLHFTLHQQSRSASQYNLPSIHPFIHPAQTCNAHFSFKSHTDSSGIVIPQYLSHQSDYTNLLNCLSFNQCHEECCRTSLPQNEVLG